MPPPETHLPSFAQALMAWMCRFLHFLSRITIKLFPAFKGPIHELGSDRLTINFHHLVNFGRLPRLDHPVTYAEKMSWLKLNHPSDLLQTCSDKLSVRGYLAKKGLAHLSIPVVAEFESPEDFSLEGLPHSFVIKANHGSSFFHICREKEKLDVSGLKKDMGHWLAADFSRWFAETNYRGIRPRLLVEPYIEGAEEMVEFKFFCFHGEPKFVSVITSRRGRRPVRGIYGMNWEPCGFGTRGLIHDPLALPCPEPFPVMIQYAKALSEDFMHVRVDLMLVKGTIYFSELTFYNLGGFGRLEPEEANAMVGSWLDLSRESEYRKKANGQE